MPNILKRYLKGDYVIWMVYFALCVVSMVEMFSASSRLIGNGVITGPILRHVLILGAGCVLVVLVQLVNYRYVRMFGYVGLLVSWVLLVFTLLYGTREGGAARWLDVGGFHFQPSEVARLSLIIVVADWIERAQANPEYVKRHFWKIGVAILVTCGLLITEGFSTFTLLFLVVCTMLFIGKIPSKNLFSFVGIIVLFISVMLLVSFNLYKAGKYDADYVPASKFEQFYRKAFKRSETWVARINNFGKQSSGTSKYVRTDSNIQEWNAHVAIARGMPGRGPGNSIQRNYLPNADNDFIYAIIIEETGLAGGIFVIALYLILLFRAGIIAAKCRTAYPMMVVVGVSLMIVFQAFMHICINVGLGPVTGQSLPLISRGGTSIFVTSIYFGIMLGISHYLTANNDATPEAVAAAESETQSQQN